MSIFETPVHVIGGQGGGAFSFNAAASGRILSKIGVWAGRWYLGSIRLWWTGLDNPTTFGTTRNGPYREFTFEDGERITSLSLWGNGAGTRSGAIRFRTSREREFFHHMTSWGLRQEFPIVVASGLCVGVIGRHGHHIDSLGFVFLRPIAFARMINVSYPTLDLERGDIEEIVLDTFNETNDSGSLSRNWVFRGSQEVAVSSSWAITAGIEFHASVTVQAGIPVLVRMPGRFGWTISASSTYATTHHLQNRPVPWERSGVLLPGQSISLQALTLRGTISLPYEATMQITLQNGSRLIYPINSLYSGVDYTSAWIDSIGSRASSEATISDTGVNIPATVPYVKPVITINDNNITHEVEAAAADQEITLVNSITHEVDAAAAGEESTLV